MQSRQRAGTSLTSAPCSSSARICAYLSSTKVVRPRGLSISELSIRTAARDAPETYKVRQGKKKAANEARNFGGLNVLFFVGRWQLPPVKQTAISENPFVAHLANVLKIMNMFWTNDIDAINHRIELTEAKRCEEILLLAYIQECRDGRQTWDMYNFIHGFPTRVTGSYVVVPPGTMESGRSYKLLCDNEDCCRLCEETWETL